MQSASSPDSSGSTPGTLARLTGIGLALGRLAVGAALWAAPSRALGALGFRRLDDRGVAVARLAATRDVVLGAWMLASLGEEVALRRAAVAGALCDGGDAVAFGLLARDGETRPAVLGAALAVPAAAAGIWLATSAGR